MGDIVIKMIYYNITHEVTKDIKKTIISFNLQFNLIIKIYFFYNRYFMKVKIIKNYLFKNLNDLLMNYDFPVLCLFHC